MVVRCALTTLSIHRLQQSRKDGSPPEYVVVLCKGVRLIRFYFLEFSLIPQAPNSVFDSMYVVASRSGDSLSWCKNPVSAAGNGADGSGLRRICFSGNVSFCWELGRGWFYGYPLIGWTGRRKRS